MVIKEKLVDLSFQGASIPFMNTEWHAQAVLESIKAEWAKNKEVYALFIDFKKAYDSVNGEVLSATLKRLGFPPKLISLLAHWNRTRTTTLYVNGEASAPIPTQCGIGQGDVFSCILYIIFINSLHAFLKSKNQGISPYPGMHFTAAGFVDDVAALAGSLPAAQTTARAVHEWGSMFGHQIQTAPHKTAILHLPKPGRISLFYQNVLTAPPTADIPTISPATLEDGRVVPFTSEYKYLGYMLKEGLPEDAHLQRTIAYIRNNHNRYFAYNGITRTICPTATCQILKTTCLPNYLASIINPTTANIRTLDSAIHPLMRTLLSGLPMSTPSIFLHSESNMPSGRYLLTRSILTTLLNLSISTYKEAPMVSLYHSMRTMIAARQRIPSDSWLARAMDYFSPYVAPLGDYMDISTILQLPAGYNITPSDATLATTVYARMVCEKAARVELQRLVNSGKCTRTVTAFSHAPAPGPPKQHYHDLQFGLHHLKEGAAYPSKYVPLSCVTEMGPCITARVTVPLPRANLIAIRAARLGACCLHYSPLAPLTWVTEGPRTSEHFRAVAHGKHCPFCEGTTADPRHILCDCTHPATATARAAVLDRATAFIPTLAKHIYSATPKPTGELRDTYYALLSLPPRPDWSTPSGKTLLHRLTLALPWPEACVDDPAAAHARLLGRLMDLTIVRNSRLHPIANSWVSWGSKALLRMCAVWASAVDSGAAPQA